MARRRDPFGGDLTGRAVPRQASIVPEVPSLGEGAIRRRAPVSTAPTATRTVSAPPVSAPAEAPRRRTLSEVPARARPPMREAVPSELGVATPEMDVRTSGLARRRFQPTGEQPREAPTAGEFPHRRVGQTPRLGEPGEEEAPTATGPSGDLGFTPSGNPVADLKQLQRGTPNNENFLQMLDALKAAYPGRVSDVGPSATGVWDKIVIDGMTHDVIESATGESGRWMDLVEGPQGGGGAGGGLFGGGGGGGGGASASALQPAVMGILQRFPHNPAGLQAASAELQSMGITIVDPESGRIQLPDGSIVDVLLATDQDWQWLPAGGGGGGLPSGLIPGSAGPFQGPLVQSETDPLSQAVNQAFLALTQNLTGQGNFRGIAGGGQQDISRLLMQILGGARQ